MAMARQLSMTFFKVNRDQAMNLKIWFKLNPYKRFTRQLRALEWLVSQCFAQFSTFIKSATKVFAPKNFQKDIINSKICYRYD